MVWEPQQSCAGNISPLRISVCPVRHQDSSRLPAYLGAGRHPESRADDSIKRTNMRNIRARLVMWIATKIVMMIDRSLQMPQELDEI